MKGKLMLGIIMLLTLALTTIASATQIPVEILEVEVNDIEIQQASTNRLVLERGEEFEVKVVLKALQDVKKVELQAFIAGFEFNSDKEERLSSFEGPFDVQANQTRVKTLRLSLPKELDTDAYKLRIMASAGDYDDLLQNYNLQVEATRHKLMVEDVVFAPGRQVKAGQAVLATVRLENKGQKEEEDVKVTVSAPELGLSATDYISKIKVEQEEETEEMYLKLPRCAEPGTYEVNVDVWYNEGRDRLQKKDVFTVFENEACREPAEKKTEVVVINQTPPPAETAPATEGPSTVRRVLEGVLLVLVALLVIVGLIIGFTRLGQED